MEMLEIHSPTSFYRGEVFKKKVALDKSSPEFTIFEIYKEERIKINYSLRQKINFYFKCVKILFLDKDDNRRSVWAEVSSLALSLGIPTHQLRKEYNKGNLQNLIDSRLNMRKTYFGALKNWIRETEEEIRSLKSREVVKISPEQLQEVMSKAFETPPEEEKIKIIQLGEKKYLVSKNEKGKINIFYAQSIRLFVEGRFSKMYEVLNITSGKTDIFKTYNETAYKNDLEVEYKLLKFIHTKKPIDIEEIQDYPRCWISWDVEGYVMKKYFLGSLFDAINGTNGALVTLNPEERRQTALIAGYKLSRALEFLIRIGILHSDIKVDNILVYKKPKTEKLIFKIADFGGVGFENNPPLVWTREYLPERDQVNIKKAEDNNDTETATLLFCQHAVFCLGVVLFAIMAGELPYHIQKSSRHPLLFKEYFKTSLSPTELSSDQVLENLGYGPLTRDLMASMLHEDPFKRTNCTILDKKTQCSELVMRWSDILNSEYS